MGTQDTLFLHEELMLLALRNEDGTVAPGSMYQYAIGGAVVAELLLQERIELEEGGKKHVNLLSSDPVGDPLVDECLDRIVHAKKLASLQTWVSRCAGVRQLKHRVAQRLCQRGILRAEQGKFLLFFTRKVYPEADPRPKREMIERLHEAIFSDAEDVDPRTVVLLSLANGMGMLNAAFGRKELKARKTRIKQLVEGELTGAAAQGAMQSAVMAASSAQVLLTTTVVR